MRHGGNVYRLAAAGGFSPENIIDFSASINPLGMPRAAKAAITGHLADILRYPDPDCSELTETIARRYGVPEGRIMCGNGSTEFIFLLPRALKPRKVLVPYPTFSEYDRACLLAGARIKHVSTGRARAFVPDVETFTRAMEGVDMAFLCNPGNPSGKALERGGVLGILRAAERERCVLVVDEAFMEFCPEHSVLGHDSPYLVVLRSLTKFYGLAGLRAGFARLPGGLGRKLRTFKEPWTVNALAQRAAAAALDEEPFAERTRKYMARQKKFLEGAFRSMGLRFYPSDANYYLIESEKAGELIDGLFERAIAVRDCSNFKGLGKSYFRVAVRSGRENALLANGMSEILGEEA